MGVEEFNDALTALQDDGAIYTSIGEDVFSITD
jgi:hypothetical protein